MNAGHETRDADVGSLFLIAISLFLGGVLVSLCVWGLMHLLRMKEAAHEEPSPSSRLTTPLSEPRLETKFGISLQEVHRREETQLNSYGWINGNAGLVHIPIDRAMELITTRGLPDIGASKTPLQLMQARPQESRPSPSPQ